MGGAGGGRQENRDTERDTEKENVCACMCVYLSVGRSMQGSGENACSPELSCRSLCVKFTRGGYCSWLTED